MAQRIIFVNLHANWMLVKTSAVFLFKNSAAVKHKYLLDYLLNNPDYEVCNYINDRGFSIYTKGGDTLQKFLNIFSRLESRTILKKNGYAPKKITIITNPKDIRKDDIILTYNLLSTNYRGLDGIDAFKATSMIHYGGQASQYDLIKEAGIKCFVCEVDLSKSSELFRRYTTVNLPWVVHPFVFAERFQNRKPFEERKTMAFSTGTITYKHEKEFIEVYGAPCDQPIRKIVKDNPDYYAGLIDCTSQDYIEDSDEKKILPSDNFFVKLYKRLYNRTHVGRQTKYFSFDMVEKFNDYKMHIVGEEILGVPGIGYVEGMACGSAYIGLDSPMYRDLGLIPGVHYIAYDGTKEGLRKTVEYYQRPENQAELERIAATGCQFVRQNFCGPKVAQLLIEKLVSQKNSTNL